MNKKGQVDIMIKILIMFLVVTVFVMLIPAFADSIDYGLDGLNCAGTPDYNETLGEKSSIGCVAFKLYIPYLVLAVLIVLVARLFAQRTGQVAQEYIGG